MSRTTFIIGLIVSVAIHLLLFLPLPFNPLMAERPAEESEANPVRIDPAALLAAAKEMDEPEEEPEPEPLPEPEPEVEPEPEPEPMPEPEPEPEPEPAAEAEAEPKPLFEQVIEPERVQAVAGAMGDQADRDDDQRLPTLQILWSGPDEVRRVAAALGMRIVAVTSDQRVLGEVTAQGATRLQPFEEDLARFSNRVRTLPAGFFGLAVQRATEEPVASYWLLVPAAVDRLFADIQREAIASRGKDEQDVTRMEAKFGGTDAARPRLMITTIDATND